MPEILAVGRDRALKNGLEPGGPCGSDVLSVYVKGGPRYELDGVAFEMSLPAAILIPAGTVDRDVQVGEVDGLFVLFKGAGLLERARPGCVAVAASAGAPACVMPFLKKLGASEAARLLDLLRRIARVPSMDQQGCLRRAALLFEALCEYCGEPGARARGVHREAQRLRELVDARACDTIAMAELYRQLGITPGQAAMLFARAFGMSPGAYRKQVRLTRARELLVSTSLNVRQTAYEVGFSDPLYFSRVFRRYFGVTPSSLVRDFAGSRA